MPKYINEKNMVKTRTFWVHQHFIMLIIRAPGNGTLASLNMWLLFKFKLKFNTQIILFRTNVIMFSDFSRSALYFR